jgi:hypothetical protein
VPINLKAYGYTEDEYYQSGTANVYNVVPNSNYQTTVFDSGPYTTRFIVNRPTNMKQWSGRVVVEMINTSAGYDWTAMWGALWQSVIARHDIYIGVTVKPNVFPGMVTFDAARYGQLSMANPLPPAQQTCGLLPSDPGYNPNLSKLYENGLWYDMVAQLGELLKSNSPSNPLGRPAARVYLSGESQQGGYVTRYYKWITPMVQPVTAGDQPLHVREGALRRSRSVGDDRNAATDGARPRDRQRAICPRRQRQHGGWAENARDAGTDRNLQRLDRAFPELHRRRRPVRLHAARVDVSDTCRLRQQV